MSSAVHTPEVATLDVNDLLRLAVQDERFATALVREPGRFEKAFQLSATSLIAISEAVSFNDFTAFQQLEEVDGGFDYE